MKPEPRTEGVDVPMCSRNCDAYDQELYADQSVRFTRCALNGGASTGPTEPCIPYIRAKLAVAGVLADAVRVAVGPPARCDRPQRAQMRRALDAWDLLGKP